jgi:hypothetical protein
MDACTKMNFWFNLGSDEKTLKEYQTKAAKGKNFTYFDEKQYFQDLVKEHGEAASAACPTIEISTTTKERPSKRKSCELLSPEDLVKIAKEQQQQKRQIIAPKTSRRRRKSL